MEKNEFERLVKMMSKEQEQLRKVIREQRETIEKQREIIVKLSYKTRNAQKPLQ